MSKYAALHDYLLNLADDSWSVTFKDVESVLGFPLPNSARKHRPWWGNQNQNSGHSHALAWADAGWKTSNVDLASESLTFLRVGHPRKIEPKRTSPDEKKGQTVQQKLLRFMQERSPESVTNQDIAVALDRSPNHIYQETSLLERRGILRSEKEGKTKHYYLAEPELIYQSRKKSLTPSAFEDLARQLFSDHFGVQLEPSKIDGVPKTFDLVSEDGGVVGDAKYYTMVKGHSLPPAKFSTIAEYVWLLEKTAARERFLVFGNDRRVPEEWLKRYGTLVGDVQFFFVTADAKIEALNGEHSKEVRT